MNAASLSVRVARKLQETPDICGFELMEIEGRPLPAFSAGAHIDVHLPGDVTRQYSLCNDPTESHRYQIGVLKDPATRGGSKAMHEQVRAGNVLRISAPKNHFPLAHEARRSLLLAGGIGVTPILCMAERLASSGAEFEMHYCTRSKAGTAFRARIDDAAFASLVRFHFDDGAPDQKLDMRSLLGAWQEGTHLYVCGPKGFMDAALSMAREAGWPQAQVHHEYFAAEVLKSDADAGFEVKLASSGRVVVVPRDMTVTQALAAAGLEVETSCEQGVCGTCLTRVLGGVPDHRDSFLTAREQSKNDQFMPCCSRSKSPCLVLDL